MCSGIVSSCLFGELFANLLVGEFLVAIAADVILKHYLKLYGFAQPRRRSFKNHEQCCVLLNDSLCCFGVECYHRDVVMEFCFTEPSICVGVSLLITPNTRPTLVS